MEASSCPAGIYQVDRETADRIRAASNALSVWTIDGAVANRRESFFSALAEELGFPPYFGRNWDATYDCLTDQASAGGPRAVLLISDGNVFVAEMGPEWETAQRVFADVAGFWRSQDRLFLVLLVADTAPEGVSELSSACQDQLLPDTDEDREITEADERIRSLNKAGNFDEAMRLAKELVQRFPRNARAHFVLGGTYDSQGRETDAVLPYQQAWELGLSGDDVPRFYVQYGSTLRNVGQYPESVRILREGRDRFPEDQAIQAFLALSLFSAGQAGDALAAALSIVIRHSDSIDLRGYERALRDYCAELRTSNAGT